MDNCFPKGFMHIYLYNTARNFLYVGDIIRNIIEIKEMHVVKMNALNNATYSMIDLNHCHYMNETLIRYYLMSDPDL